MPTDSLSCPNCNFENRRYSRYCNKCGYPLDNAEETESAAKEDSPPLALTADYKNCAQCQTVNPATAKYCSHCGLLLPQEAQYAMSSAPALAGFGIRVGAYMIDTIVVRFIWLIAAVGITHKSVTEVLEVFTDITSGQPLDKIAYFILIAIDIAYFTFTTGRWGQTIGKAILGLKVQRTDGSPVSYLRSLARSAASYLSGMALGIGFLMIAFSPQKRGLHDLICDTRVLKIKK